MNQLSVSYGLITSPQQSISNSDNRINSINNNKKDSIHILPISKILLSSFNNIDYNLTISRDGSIVLHDLSNRLKNIRLQIHCDWCSDIIQIGSNSFISVSHDLSIILINIYKSSLPNNDYEWHWDKSIIGYHDDYIKCVVNIPNSNMFATAGLDSFIKIWSYQSDLDSNYINDNIQLLQSFQNISYTVSSSSSTSTKKVDAEPASIYNLLSIDNSSNNSYPYDLIFDDCNGDIIFYSIKDNKEYKRINAAHKTNIKVLKLLNNSKHLLSTCSDGIVKIWDLRPINDNFNLIMQFKWNCSIWSIYNEQDNDILQNGIILGDSVGNISKLKIDMTNKKILSNNLIFNSKIYFTNQNMNNTKFKHFGILDLKLSSRDNSLLFFTYCSDSNLNCLNLTTCELTQEKGGIALTRSSLLTNRRHVITENTEGMIQRWDIVSCELVNTFDPGEGSFDDIVVVYTSKEILSHWCTVSIKVGMLFVKIGPKFLNTEIYGSAFENYNIINKEDIEINPDLRYNLGKVVVYSLFNDLMKYEISKDDSFRKKLSASHMKRKSKDNNFSSYNSDSSYSEITSKRKEKSKMKATLANLGSSMTSSHTPPASNSILTSSQSHELNTPYVSAPTTPLSREIELSNDVSHMDLNHHDENEILQPHPKTTTTRALSSGSLFSRKFRSFRNSSKINDNDDNNDDNYNNNRPHTSNDILTKNENISHSNKGRQLSNNNMEANSVHETLNSVSKDPVNFNHSIFKSERNTPSLDIHSQYKSNENSRHSTPVPTENINAGTNNENTTVANNKQEFMSDLLDEMHESYINQLNNSSSLKLLSKKLPDSKIVRDLNLPVVQVKSGTLLMVHYWKEGSCGGRVLSSILLPPTKIKARESGEENSSSSTLSELSDSAELLDEPDLDNINLTGDLFEHNTSIYKNLENTLPYWLAKELFKETGPTNDKQPKLNFVIIPWVSDRKKDETGYDNDKTDYPVTSPTSPQQFHNMFKLGRSKSNNNSNSSTNRNINNEDKEPMTDLPKISESNTKLTAPGMIKVKKIKNYVVDRFETKTPEMKNKVLPSDWLELLCKGEILDNDMTLSTVRTLYWKSQSEIVFEYRRKVPK